MTHKPPVQEAVLGCYIVSNFPNFPDKGPAMEVLLLIVLTPHSGNHASAPLDEILKGSFFFFTVLQVHNNGEQ